MFYGIGTDIIEISRIKKALETPKFKERIFTEDEINLMGVKGDRIESYAGRFSGKEAIAKGLGTGVRGFNLCDIEILADELGKPIVKFKNKLEEYENKYQVHLSISHCKEYATATAIIIKNR